MPNLLDQLQDAVAGRNTLIYIHSAEEDRVERSIRAAAEADGAHRPVAVWSCVNGLEGVDDVEREQTREPLAAINAIRRQGIKGFVIMKDLSAFVEDPAVTRALRELYYACRNDSDTFLCILAPSLVIPASIQKEVYLISSSLPAEDEIEEQIEWVRQYHSDIEIPDSARPELVTALKGLTVGETAHVLHRVFDEENFDLDNAIDRILDEKEQIVRKSGYLEFVAPRWDIDSVGGLDNLKDWLTKRSRVFSRDAVEQGVPVPKGLLVMGVSGCGKSLAVKVISSLWNVPLFRLDMSLIFSGIYGSPEAAFRGALRTVESVAPAILWIDEIENSMGLGTEQSQLSAHIFSTFLTWMQEKPPLVFLAATANRIHDLPAEIIRKGRFDQVFFVDLPNAVERREILEIHLDKNDADMTDYDPKMMSIMTEDWTGAEIEQAVISARVEAYYEKRALTMRDLSASMNKIVPLSMTMEEQIKSIRDWAYDRATPATKPLKSKRYNA